MIMEYRSGLLFTEIEIVFKNKSKIINNIVIDTGASKTLISQDSVEDIDIRINKNDPVITSYGIGGEEHAFVKTVDSIILGDYTFKKCQLDFARINYSDINGLLGLDLLIGAGVMLDLNKLKCYALKSK